MRSREIGAFHIGIVKIDTVKVGALKIKYCYNWRRR